MYINFWPELLDSDRMPKLLSESPKLFLQMFFCSTYKNHSFQKWVIEILMELFAMLNFVRLTEKVDLFEFNFVEYMQ